MNCVLARPLQGCARPLVGARVKGLAVRLVAELRAVRAAQKLAGALLPGRRVGLMPRCLGWGLQLALGLGRCRLLVRPVDWRWDSLLCLLALLGVTPHWVHLQAAETTLCLHRCSPRGFPWTRVDSALGAPPGWGAGLRSVLRHFSPPR